MNATEVIEALLDDAPYEEIARPVNAYTAKRLDAFSQRLPHQGTGTVFLTIGGARYRRDGTGDWFRIRKVRNHAYWEKPNYFVIYGTMRGQWTMIFCKIPRTATQVAFRRACKAIARDYTGEPVPWSEIHVEGSDEKMYTKRAAGKAPEPAYAIDGMGQFTRESQRP